MNENEFRQLTKTLALDTIHFVENLPRTKTADILGRQLLRCSTSVAANYRSACRAKSSADMVHKLAIVEEEGDETMFWLEILMESRTVAAPDAIRLMQQADEIVAMTVSSIKTLRRGM